MEPFAKYDFTFLEITEGTDRDKYYKDYIFETSKKADRELVHYFGEQGLEHVFKIIYASETDELIAERTYLFGVNYRLVKNEVLKNMIKEKISDL